MLIHLSLNLYHIIFPTVSPATAAIYIFDHLGAMRTGINCLGSVYKYSSFWPSKREGISFPIGSTHKNFTAFAACYNGVLHEVVIAASRQVRKYY